MDAEALQSMLEADPKSYDLGMLSPMRKSLEAASANAGAAGDEQAQGQIDMLHQAVSALETEQTRRLDEYAVEALEDFEKAVVAKRDVEQRMIDDDRMYNGVDTQDNSKAYPNDANDQYDNNNTDRPVLQAIRSRTIRYAARLTDMFGNELPIEVCAAKNPDPQCFPGLDAKVKQMQQQNQQFQVTPEFLLDYASDTAQKMQACISDQLEDQRFNDIKQRVIFDGCKWGYGICKGPTMDLRKKRKPMGQQCIITLDESPTPGCAYVDPWFFYYDMTPTLDESSQCWEVHLMDRRRLNDLKRYPNIIEANIDELLKEKDPKLPTELSTNLTTRNARRDAVETLKNRWAVIEMHGLIDPDKLEEITGQPWTDPKSLPLIEFWFCNGKALKWKLSPMECDWRVPYYNFTPFPCDDTIFGDGVPRMGRGGGKLVKGALDATMLNASCSAGPFIAVAKGAVAPANGAFVIKGPKMLEVETDGDISKAIYSFMVDSNVDGNLALLQKGLDFLDDDILLDQITQGDIASEEMPASGLLQVINIKSIFQRMIAARADETWFKQMGERWGQWNLQFNPDNSIKGDFDYKGIASTTLVSKDLQIQHLQVGMQVSAQPQFAGMVNHYEELSSYYRMLDVPNREAIVYDKATADKNAAAIQQAGSDPMVAVKQAELQLKQQMGQADNQLKQQEMALAHQERMAEIQRQSAKDASDAQAAHEANMTTILVAQSKKDVAIMSLAQATKQTVMQIASAMQQAGLDADTKKVLAEMDFKAKAIKEVGDTARTAASLGVQTTHKVADIRQKDRHKVADIAMQQNQHAHESAQADKAAANMPEQPAEAE